MFFSFFSLAALRHERAPCASFSFFHRLIFAVVFLVLLLLLKTQFELLRQERERMKKKMKKAWGIHALNAAQSDDMRIWQSIKHWLAHWLTYTRISGRISSERMEREQEIMRVCDIEKARNERIHGICLLLLLSAFDVEFVAHNWRHGMVRPPHTHTRTHPCDAMRATDFYYEFSFFFSLLSIA